MTDAIGKLYALLEPGERKRLWLLALIMVVVGMLEAAGVASVLPFLAVLSNPSLVDTDPRLAFVHDLTGLSQHGFLVLLGVVSLLFLIGSLVARALALWASTRFVQLRQYTLSSRLLRGYLARPYADVLGAHSSDVSKTLLSEVEKSMQALGGLITALAQCVVFLSIVAVVVAVNPVAALAAAAIVGGTFALMATVLRRHLRRIGGESLAANQERFRAVQETIHAVKDIKVMGLEAAFHEAYRAPALTYAQRQAAFGVVTQMPRIVLEGVAFGAMILFLLAMLTVGDGDVLALLPTLGVLAVAGIRLLPSAQQIFYGLNALRYNAPSIRMLHADMQAMPAPVPPYAGPPLPLRREIVLEGVGYTFAGADRPALDGLSLAIAAGTSVAFVGPTGAGKTTAVDVILGLLPPQAGRVLVDGVALEGPAVRAFQKSIGYVPQHIFLADATIAQNIAFGVPEAEIDMAAVARAARIAALDAVVAERPEGFATMVGERGAKLSGGQRQRIGIARALYHDPSVLVLDEATSALDNLTERQVMEAIGRMADGTTVIMIAHRLTTVRACDAIFVLERGRVVATGRYDALVERNARFRALALASEAA